jgi:hypothetical protein
MSRQATAGAFSCGTIPQRPCGSRTNDVFAYELAKIERRAIDWRDSQHTRAVRSGRKRERVDARALGLPGHAADGGRLRGCLTRGHSATHKDRPPSQASSQALAGVSPLPSQVCGATLRTGPSKKTTRDGSPASSGVVSGGGFNGDPCAAPCTDRFGTRQRPAGRAIRLSGCATGATGATGALDRASGFANADKAANTRKRTGAISPCSAPGAQPMAFLFKWRELIEGPT